MSENTENTHLMRRQVLKLPLVTEALWTPLLARNAHSRAPSPSGSGEVTRPWRSLAQQWGVTGRGLARGIRRGLPSRARAAPPDAGCSARAPGLAGHALSRRQCRSQEEDVTSQVRKPVLRDAVSCLREESSEF